MSLSTILLFPNQELSKSEPFSLTKFPAPGPFRAYLLQEDARALVPQVSSRTVSKDLRSNFHLTFSAELGNQMRQPWKIYDFHYYDMGSKANCFCPLVYRVRPDVCLNKKKRKRKRRKAVLTIALNKAVWSSLSLSLLLYFISLPLSLTTQKCFNCLSFFYSFVDFAFYLKIKLSNWPWKLAFLHPSS